MPGIHFCVLGPLAVRLGDRALDVGPRKQRALLAVLLLNRNTIVSSDRLAEALWGDELPASAATGIHVYVSRLRRALEPQRKQGASSELLVTRPPGYMIRLGPDELDLERFERLVAEGREALHAERPDAAAARLREALAVWRGGALDDLAFEPFAQAEIARLEEQRLAAVGDRIDADLALGRHAELIGELEALAAEHPFRERTRRQLMLALYRSGRQAEALAAYQDARRALVERLGIEPTPALQRLHQEILLQEPTLELERAGARPGPQSAAEVRAPPAAVRKPQDERKLVTVVVGELAATAARGDPERTRALLDRLHEAIAAEIVAAGGTPERSPLHVVTGLFGVPLAHQDHAKRALHAALAMRRRVVELSGAGASLRIGVDTGQVLAAAGRGGVVDVAGEAPASAMRLAQAAERNGILVGERTVADAGEAFRFGPPTERRVPERSIACRVLTGLRPAGPARRRTARFVGRESELAVLEATYRRVVLEGEPHVVTLIGDAGIGKSRLAAELAARLEGLSPQPVRRTGHCLAYGRAITYWPLGEILREHLGATAADDPEVLAERLQGREILGLAVGLDLAGDLHPAAARERFKAAWVELMDELVADGPAVVYVEDVHWAEEPLLDLLAGLARQVRGPLMLVATARPELFAGTVAWASGGRNATTLWLEPLPETDARHIVEVLGDDLPRSLQDAVVARAEGNPFFAEEIVGSLIDRDVLAADADPGGLELAVPDSIHGAIASRIDVLPPAEKAALQTASVIGRTFAADAVSALAGARPDFAALEDREFLRRGASTPSTPAGEYWFKHALTRDVAYASLPRARRLLLHAAFADWLEDVGEGRGEHAPLLAHHYAEAADADGADIAWKEDEAGRARVRRSAVRWLRRAAELAMDRYELDEGQAMVERALALDPPPADRAQLWRALGRASAMRYDGEGLWSAMHRAIEHCSDPHDRADLYSELAIETAIRAGIWTRRPAPETVNRWIDQALELAEPRSAARAKALIARANFTPSLAAEAAAEVYTIADELGDPDLRSWALDARGIAAFVSGDFEAGRNWEERRLELLDRITDPDHIADLYYGPVSGYAWEARFDEMRRSLARHDRVTEKLSPHHRLHGVAALIEAEDLAAGWARIRALEQRTERDVHESRATPCARGTRALLVCAVAETCLGDDAAARRLEESAERVGMEGYGHVLAAPRMRLALLRCDLEALERLLDGPPGDRIWHRGWFALSSHAARIDALAALGRRDELIPEHWPHARPGSYLEPFLLRALGLVQDDETLVQRAHERFRAIGLQWHADQTPRLDGCRMYAGSEATTGRAR